VAIQESARSERRVCGRLLAGTMSSNPAGGMDVFLLYYGLATYGGLRYVPIPRPEESYRSCVCH